MAQIQAFDRLERQSFFDKPEQLKDKDFIRIFINRGDWSEDQIRDLIRPALKKFGGILVER